jgi:hypothetical protein
MTAEGGVLEELRELSEALAEVYGWHAGQATTFVLTGLVPLLALVEVRFKQRPMQVASRIVVEADPALSPKEVAEAYRSVRQQVLGPRHRELTRKHLLLAYVAATKPASMSWSQLMGEWNAQIGQLHPEWRYDQVTNFARDGRRAIERVLNPDYQAQWVSSSSEEETDGEAREQ